MKKYLLLLLLLPVLVAGVIVQDRPILKPGWWNTPQYHGASGDSTSDALAALQAAVVRIDTVKGGVLFLPPGVYRLSGPLTINIDAVASVDDTIPFLTIIGSGQSSRLIVEGAGGINIQQQGVEGAGYVLLKDFAIWNKSSSNAATYGLRMKGVYRFSIEDVSVFGRNNMDNGYDLEATQQGRITGGFLNQLDTAIALDSLLSIYPNGIHISGVSIAGGDTALASKTIGIFARVQGPSTIIGNHIIRTDNSVGRVERRFSLKPDASLHIPQ